MTEFNPFRRAVAIAMLLLGCYAVGANEYLDRKLAEKSDSGKHDIRLHIDPALSPQGFRIVPEADGAVTVSGGSKRGLYYGLNALRFPVTAPVTAAPEWEYRFADEQNCFEAPTYLKLADSGISGFAWQWRQEWRDFSPDHFSGNWRVGTVADALREIAKAQATGLLDFMLVLHIYATNGARTYPWFDCSSDADIAALTERCRMAAKAGVGHIMICADDWTPRENGRYVCPNKAEREYFGDSVGKAHGTLMRKLYEALHAEFPELVLSFCGAVYSGLHISPDPAKAEAYLADFDRVAPNEVRIVWTGPEVISRSVTKADHAYFTRALNSGRKTLFWDNSECLDQPLPVWDTTFYPEMARDHEGMIFLNEHVFGWEFSWPFTLDANDYLWNAAVYDWRRAYGTNNTARFGAETAVKLLAWRDRLMELRRAAAQNDRARQVALLAELEPALVELKTGGVPTDRLEAALAAVRDRLEIAARTIEIPILTDPAAYPASSAHFELRANSDVPEATPKWKTKADAAIVGGALRLTIHCEQPNLADVKPVVCLGHDDTVYNNPETVELFVQPGENTQYGHLAFDVFGNRFDQRNMDGPDSWNPNWTLECIREKDGWRAEITIPLVEFEELGCTPPGPGVIWRVNIMRVPADGSPISVLAPTKNYGFHTPEFFGVFKMVKP